MEHTAMPTPDHNTPAHHMRIRALKEIIRRPYDGLYHRRLLMADGALMCPECAYDNYKPILQACAQSAYGTRNDWLCEEHIVTDTSHWHGRDDTGENFPCCVQCQELLPANYTAAQRQRDWSLNARLYDMLVMAGKDERLGSNARKYRSIVYFDMDPRSSDSTDLVTVAMVKGTLRYLHVHWSVAPAVHALIEPMVAALVAQPEETQP
jgi:hypothetical protein